MHRWRIYCVFVAFMALAGCTTTGSEPAESSPPRSAPSSVPKGTQAITVDPWANEVRQTPLPTVSSSPSRDNACYFSRVPDRSDAYFCVYENDQGDKLRDDFCIANPTATEEYACLDRDLNWHVLRGIEIREERPSLQPVTLSNYVYLKLTDGTMCWRSSTPGPPHMGDYVLFGSCSDGTGYWTRFVSGDVPSDASSPYGEGTDADGHWLVKTGTTTLGELTTRSVETAYR